jgi:hypothetical protein
MRLTLLAVVGCASAAPAQIDRRVHVVRTPPLSTSADRLVFPSNQELLARQPGDLIVGAGGSGFLRQVTRVARQADQIVVDTAPASLTDAIIEAEYTSQLLDDKSDLSGPSLNGVFLGFGNTELAAGGGATVTITKGSFAFHPAVDIALDIRDSVVHRFDLVASGDLDADLAFHVEGHGQTEVTVGKDLWTSPPQAFVQTIGTVPVVEVVTVTVSAELSLASDDGMFSLDIGASAHARVEAGQRYIEGTWNPAGTLDTLTIDPSDPVFTGSTSVHAELALPVQLQVSFYDLAGPYVALAPNVAATYAPADGLVADWGLTGSFGGSVDLLGAGNDDRLLGFDSDLFDFTCLFGQSVQDCLAATGP